MLLSVPHFFCKRSTLFFILGIFTILLLGSCNPFQPLKYLGLSNFNLKPKSFAESNISATVQVYNPNSGQLMVKRIMADIVVNDKTWGSYKLDSTFQIPAKDTFSFPIALKVKNSYLLSSVMDVAGGKQLPYKLKGTIRGSYKKITAEVPFEHSGQFSEKDIKF